jgi:hypothetical protein
MLRLAPATAGARVVATGAGKGVRERGFGVGEDRHHLGGGATMAPLSRKLAAHSLTTSSARDAWPAQNDAD